MPDTVDSVTVAYFLAFCGAVFIFVFYRFRSLLADFRDLLRFPILKYLTYPIVFGGWNRAELLTLLGYLAVNVFCLWFRSPSLSASGRRAGNLSLTNLIFQYAAMHLDSLTNSLGLGWRAVRRLHGSIGIVAILLLVFHVIAAEMSSESFPLNVPHNMWAAVAASTLATVSVLSIPFFKKRLYEGFLRVHQVLAIVSVYGTWMHLAPQPLVPRLFLCSLIGISSSTTLLLISLIIYRNGLTGSGLPRAEITNYNGIILIKVKLSRPISVEAGQWVGLWVFTQSARIRSLFQSHPFVVASWSDAPQSTLSFLIEPRSGLTHQLLRHSTLPRKSCIALFSGPHGLSVPISAYDVVVMITSGFGIAAQLPYLKKLMHEYNSRKARTRRVHLVWKLQNLSKGSGILELVVKLTKQGLATAIEELLNAALVDDTLDDGYILKISIYVENLPKGNDLSPRATVIKGSPNLEAIVREEVEGRYVRKVQEEAKNREDMIVLVSASVQVRREMREIVRNYLDDKVEMKELDYQPDE